MKFGTLVWLIVGIAVIGTGLAAGWYTLSRYSTGSKPLVLTLIDLPQRFCPKEVVYLPDSSLPTAGVGTKTLTVTNCHTVDLGSLGSSSISRQKTLLVYIPGALASSLTINKQSTNIVWYPQLGDTNNDNRIDNLDLQNIIANLNKSLTDAPTDKILDFDGDGLVTAYDLAIVKINQGVGVNRPDGKSWSEAK